MIRKSLLISLLIGMSIMMKVLVTDTCSSHIDDLHQRPWRFDYYSSIYRSPIVCNANTQFFLGLLFFLSLISA